MKIIHIFFTLDSALNHPTARKVGCSGYLLRLGEGLLSDETNGGPDAL